MEGFRLTKDRFIGTKGFIRTDSLQSLCRIINFQNDPLIADPEESSATFGSWVYTRGKTQLFNLIMFNEVAGHEDRLSVAITCEKDDKNYIISVEGDSVILKESDLPQRIPSKTSEFIFYERKHDNGFTSLESSLERGSYLACSNDDLNLLLKPCSEDEVDETAKF